MNTNTRHLPSTLNEREFHYEARNTGLAYSSHSAVIGAFGKLFAKTNKFDDRFHRYLLDAQDIRHIGDYSIGPGVTAEQVEESTQWANDFLEAAEAFLA